VGRLPAEQPPADFRRRAAPGRLAAWQTPGSAPCRPDSRVCALPTGLPGLRPADRAPGSAARRPGSRAAFRATGFPGSAPCRPGSRVGLLAD